MISFKASSPWSPGMSLINPDTSDLLTNGVAGGLSTASVIEQRSKKSEKAQHGRFEAALLKENGL